MIYDIHSGTKIQPSRTKLILPAFDLPGTWTGVPELLARYPILNTALKLSIKLPVLPVNDTYMLAISWADANDTPFRYGFWENDTFHWPMYDGERVGLNAYIEVWSVGDFNAIDNSRTLESSWLNIPSDDCNTLQLVVPDVSQILVAALFVTLNPGDPGNPFDFPLFT